MSGPLHRWYSLPDLQALGQRAAVLAGEIQLRSLKRLAGLLHESHGSVNASVSLEQLPGGWVALDLRCDAVLAMVCQRCLHPLSHSVSQQTRLVLVESDAMQSRAPEGLEPLVMEQERMRLADLIEDELILGLPLVPRHAADEKCDRQLAGSHEV
jgi:uncharacterized protein